MKFVIPSAGFTSSLFIVRSGAATLFITSEQLHPVDLEKINNLEQFIANVSVSIRGLKFNQNHQISARTRRK